jgi:CRISPR/Cas system endoribonuclease Cas6 (RAMP superfamily)
MFENIKIDFLTPIFLMRNKKPIYFPTMNEIVSAIIRRIHILSRSIWKDKDFRIDKEFIKGLDISINGYDLNFKRDFKTGGLGNTVELSGFYGSLECSGDITQLYPLLKAGELLHIGARTTYGLGKYELTVL